MARLTKPEKRAMSALMRDGVRFMATGQGRNLEFHADFLVPGLKIAIFIDGCYWHACPRHFPHDPAGQRRTRPSRVADRDRSRAVRQSGWIPFRIWECQHIEYCISRYLSRARMRLTTKAS